MKRIVREVKESMQRKKGLTFLMMFGITVFLAIAIVLLHTYLSIQEKKASVASFEGLNVYQLSDTLVEEVDWQSYLNEPGALEQVKQFYTYLEEDLQEKYIYIFTQPIHVQHTEPVNEQFLEGYEEGRPSSITKGEDGKSYHTVKAVQVNKQAFDLFPITVNKGTSFGQDDFFNDHDRNIIPILLGLDYEDVYEVGDEIEAHYLFKNYKLKVKGFIDAQSFVSSPNEPEIYLDRYIVMPVQQFGKPTTEEDTDFQEKHYFQIINGAIYSAKERDTIEAKLEKAKAFAQFPHMHIIGSPITMLGHVFTAIEESIHWLLMISVILFITSALSIPMVMRGKIRNNYKNMMIHLISGGTIRQLFRYVFIEVIVLVGIPAAFILLLLFGVFQTVLPLHTLLIVGCAVSIVILSVVPIYIQFRRLPITSLLKRKE